MKHYESEHLFRTCSGATSLVTSLEFNPICRTIKLCHFCQPWNGSGVTHFIHFSRNATSSATSENVTVLEGIGQNEKPASRNEEGSKNKPSLAPEMILNDVL